MTAVNCGNDDDGGNLDTNKLCVKTDKNASTSEVSVQVGERRTGHLEDLVIKMSLLHIKRNQEKYNTLAEKTREMGYKVRRDKEGHLLAFTPHSAIKHH